MATTNDLRQIKRKRKEKLIKKNYNSSDTCICLLIGYITKDKWLPIFDGIVYKFKILFLRKISQRISL